MTIKLDSDQQQVFDEIKYNRNQNFLIQGQAGTGKSTLINYIKNHLGREYAVIAPTGIAATLIDGTTIHSLFKLGGRPYFPHNVVDKYKKYSDVVKRIETLIIDEVSMLRADIFDTIDMLCKKAKQNNETFGGIQIVLVGDLYQLPPVYKYENDTNDAKQKEEILDAKKYIKNRYGDTEPFFFDAKCYKKGNFKLKKITIPHRQDKGEFLDNLMVISRNDEQNIEKSLEYFNSSVNDDEMREEISVVTSIKKDAEYINRKKLEELSGEVRVYHALLSGDYYDLEQIKKENRKGDPIDILESRKNNIIAPAELKLKKGAKVMLCKNALDKSYVNGTMGYVEEFLDSEEKIAVKLENGNIVKIEKADWEEKEYIKDINNPQKLTLKTIGTFQQFPLTLAYAITIHKSQGQTWKNVCIDLGENGAFSSGQVYVALSRVKNREGVHLKREITLSDIKVNPRVRDFLASDGVPPKLLSEAGDESIPSEDFENQVEETLNLKKRVSKIYPPYKGFHSAWWTIYNDELENDLYLQAGRDFIDDKIYIFKIKNKTYTENDFEPNNENRFKWKQPQKIDYTRRDISINLKNWKETLKSKDAVDFQKHLWKTIDLKKKEIIDNPDYQE